MVTRCIPLLQQWFIGVKEHLTCWFHWFGGIFNHAEAVYLVEIDSSSQQQCVYPIRRSLNCGMFHGASKTFYFFKHPKAVMILTIEHFWLSHLQCLIFEMLINIAHLHCLCVQACYGVPTIPKGKWLCRVCATGEKNTQCMLCPNRGGALKRVR